MFETAKISDAFITESRLDLLSAKLLFDKEIYSRAVYFAQQSSEKAIKSCLALRNIIAGVYGRGCKRSDKKIKFHTGFIGEVH